MDHPITCTTTSHVTTLGSPVTPPVRVSPHRTSVRSSASAAPSVRRPASRFTSFWEQVSILSYFSSCRPEPFPRLSVQSPVQYQAVPVLPGSERVRPGPLSDLRRRRPLGQQERVLQELLHPERSEEGETARLFLKRLTWVCGSHALSVSAPAARTLRRGRLGHLHQRAGPEERVHLRVLWRGERTSGG